MSHHLSKAFKEAGEEVTLINSRTLEGLESEIEFIVISVSDDAIGEVASHIGRKLTSEYKGIVCHTAGSVPLEILKDYFENYGVIYPLQTFSKENSNLDFSIIPVFVEANSKENEVKIKNVATKISNEVGILSSEKRINLHIAAVYACNFANALYGIACDILDDANVSFNVMFPLIQQTLNKLKEMSPSEAQTGPAVRNDLKVIEKHKKWLENMPEEKRIYELITNYIISSTGKRQNGQDRLRFEQNKRSGV